jgi:ABC-type glycerol-3-phosphate transport system substrate-binding protein
MLQPAYHRSPDFRRVIMRPHAIVLATALVMAPLGAKAADLVVWWEKGYYDQENEAVGEIVAAFEQRTGNEVELVLLDEEELPDAFAAALDAGQPPDFGFGTLMAPFIAQWAFGDRLVDLSDAIGSFANTFDPDALDTLFRSRGPSSNCPKPAGPRGCFVRPTPR